MNWESQFQNILHLILYVFYFVGFSAASSIKSLKLFKLSKLSKNIRHYKSPFFDSLGTCRMKTQKIPRLHAKESEIWLVLIATWVCFAQNKSIKTLNIWFYKLWSVLGWVSKARTISHTLFYSNQKS